MNDAKKLALLGAIFLYWLSVSVLAETRIAILDFELSDVTVQRQLS
jgi:hypothetical protein